MNLDPWKQVWERAVAAWLKSPRDDASFQAFKGERTRVAMELMGEVQPMLGLVERANLQARLQQALEGGPGHWPFNLMTTGCSREEDFWVQLLLVRAGMNLWLPSEIAAQLAIFQQGVVGNMIPLPQQPPPFLTLHDIAGYGWGRFVESQNESWARGSVSHQLAIDENERWLGGCFIQSDGRYHLYWVLERGSDGFHPRDPKLFQDE